jgi:hypothetical protein
MNREINFRGKRQDNTPKSGQWVFGQPVNTATAFMYLFRRYGFPNSRSDDYKDLCAYTFHTDEDDIIVHWRMNAGSYHHHLCAFASKETWYKAIMEERKPYDEWRDRARKWANKNGITCLDMETLFMETDNGDGTFNVKFIGTEDEEKIIDSFLEENDFSLNMTQPAYNKICKMIYENGKKLVEDYKKVEPFPKCNKSDFLWRWRNQLEASEIQHNWILSLPEDSPVRRVYFAAMRLFEEWKRPTYVRDINFDFLGGDGSDYNNPDEEDGYGECSISAGYSIPEKIFEEDNYCKFLEFVKTL